jgi:hypothetical protein
MALNVCSTCYEKEVPICVDEFTFNLGLVDGDYLLRFKNRFGKYIIKQLTSLNGIVTLDVTTLPEGYFFRSVVTVDVFATSDTSFCNPLSFTVCDSTYSCIILKPVSMASNASTFEVMCHCCAQPCLTVDSIEELSDYRFCQMAIVRDIGIDQFNVGLFQYIEGVWVCVAQVFENFVDGEIVETEYATLEGWSVSIEGEAAVSGEGVIAFDPALTGMDVTFINGSCTYIQPRISQVCPAICLTVNEFPELPDPPTGCEFALVHNHQTDAVSFELWIWNGASWEFLTATEVVFVDGEIVDVAYVTTGSWVISLNGNEVSGEDVYTFDPAVPTLDVIYVNGQCAYVMDRIVPPAPADLEMFLTFNAIANAPVADPSDVAEWNALFASFGGSPFAGYSAAFSLGDVVRLTAPSGQDMSNSFDGLGGDWDGLIEINDSGIFTTCNGSSCVDTMPALTSVTFDGIVQCNRIANQCEVLSSISMGNLVTSGNLCGSYMDSLVSLELPALTTLTNDGGGNFIISAVISDINTPLLTSVGSTVGDNNFWDNSQVTNCQWTISVFMQTCNAGGVEGDVVEFLTYGGNTINYV